MPRKVNIKIQSLFHIIPKVQDRTNKKIHLPFLWKGHTFSLENDPP